ncbi:MAG: hypothetical protein ACQCXQ_06535 [Verrucomicrobiales bacterium]|nr:hypothetical protein [Verrucomicrobiota bacterium JB025]
MSKTLILAVASTSLALVSCYDPPPPVNPHYPYGSNTDPYGRGYDRKAAKKELSEEPQTQQPTAPPEGDLYGTKRYPDPYGNSLEPAPTTAPEPEDTTTGSATSAGNYPSARKTTKATEVISPYAPYNVIDVEGFSSGQLARDPSNGKIFRVP